MRSESQNIDNVFRKAGFVESWGRGFKKIAEEFKKTDLPLPMIEEDGGVMAVIQRKTIDEIIRGRESGGNVGDFVGDFQNHRTGLVCNAKSWNYQT